MIESIQPPINDTSFIGIIIIFKVVRIIMMLKVMPIK